MLWYPSRIILVVLFYFWLIVKIENTSAFQMTSSRLFARTCILSSKFLSFRLQYSDSPTDFIGWGTVTAALVTAANKCPMNYFYFVVLRKNDIIRIKTSVNLISNIQYPSIHLTLRAKCSFAHLRRLNKGSYSDLLDLPSLQIKADALIIVSPEQVEDAMF